VGFVPVGGLCSLMSTLHKTLACCMSSTTSYKIPFKYKSIGEKSSHHGKEYSCKILFKIKFHKRISQAAKDANTFKSSTK
jgi:hypothetical protein